MPTDFDGFFQHINKIAEHIIDNEDTLRIPDNKESLTDKFPIAIAANGVSEDEFWKSLDDVLIATPSSGSKSFLNQLFAGRNLPALAAEMLVPIVNVSLYTYKSGGVQIALEKEVINCMLSRIGYADGGATATPGGSLSNMVAMMVARNEKIDNSLHDGIDQHKTGKLIAYTSEQSHYSIKKMAGVIGIGRNQCIKIESDEQGKMSMPALETQIKQDIANGNQPFIVIGTAGTTVLGAFDPFTEIAKICQHYNLWFHIDAAWGGGLLWNDDYKPLLNGVEQADSITWDAHKMMGVPLTSAYCFFKQADMPFKHFNMGDDSNYLFQLDNSSWNPGESSLLCGRRNDVLKVWAMLKFRGLQGMSDYIENLYQLRQYVLDEIDKRSNYHLVIAPESLNVCYTIDGVKAEDLCTELFERGHASIGFGDAFDKRFIRYICTHPHLTRDDVQQFFTDCDTVIASLN